MQFKNGKRKSRTKTFKKLEVIVKHWSSLLLKMPVSPLSFDNIGSYCGHLKLDF